MLVVQEIMVDISQEELQVQVLMEVLEKQFPLQAQAFSMLLEVREQGMMLQ